MKKQLVIIGFVVLLLTTWLSGCQSQGISVHKISGEHPNSVNMTEEQINNFPHVNMRDRTTSQIDWWHARLTSLTSAVTLRVVGFI
jgi:hypothetical protein